MISVDDPIVKEQWRQQVIQIKFLIVPTLNFVIVSWVITNESVQ